MESERLQYGRKCMQTSLTLYFIGLQLPDNLIESFLQRICNVVLITGGLITTLIHTFQLIAPVTSRVFKYKYILKMLIHVAFHSRNFLFFMLQKSSLDKSQNFGAFLLIVTNGPPCLDQSSIHRFVIHLVEPLNS